MFAGEYMNVSTVLKHSSSKYIVCTRYLTGMGAMCYVYMCNTITVTFL